MIKRKKKIRIIQFFLLTLGVLITYFTYYNKDSTDKDIISSKPIKESIPEKENKDVFFNIEYTGLDLNGNRYLLKSKEAQLDES